MLPLGALCSCRLAAVFNRSVVCDLKLYLCCWKVKKAEKSLLYVLKNTRDHMDLTWVHLTYDPFLLLCVMVLENSASESPVCSDSSTFPLANSWNSEGINWNQICLKWGQFLKLLDFIPQLLNTLSLSDFDLETSPPLNWAASIQSLIDRSAAAPKELLSGDTITCSK